MLTTLVFGGSIEATAMPAGRPDETKISHYFAPNPDWVNSPLTLPDAIVTITGNVTGKTAESIVGANGAITAITVTNPGHNYTNAKVDIMGSGTAASANATIVKNGAVVSVTVNSPGAGYTAPVVTLCGFASPYWVGKDGKIRATNGGHSRHYSVIHKFDFIAL